MSSREYLKDIREQLQRLLDIEAIRDLPRRYAHCVWSKDAAGAAWLFAEDGIMDTSTDEPVRGRAAILAAYTQSFARSNAQPYVHNHVIELCGDTATGVCYLDMRVMIDGKILIGSGDYHDVYVRQDGTWLFHSRKLNMHYMVPIAVRSTRPK